jgi:hypothetical protein
MMKKIEVFFRSREVVLLALILGLITQLSHSIAAYVILAKEDVLWLNITTGILFSLALSFGIIIFTLRGRKNLAYFYLTVEVFINIIYYRLYEIQSPYILGSTIFLSLILPITIASYSHEIAKENGFIEGEKLDKKEEYELNLKYIKDNEDGTRYYKGKIS